MTRSAADVIRIFVISGAGLTIGLACYIAVSYLRASADVDADRRWAPLTVVALAISHVMYTSYGAVTIIERLGDPVSYHSPYLGSAAALSCSALFVAARDTRRRIIGAKRAAELGYPQRRADDLYPRRKDR